MGHSFTLWMPLNAYAVLDLLNDEIAATFTEGGADILGGGPRARSNSRAWVRPFWPVVASMTSTVCTGS